MYERELEQALRKSAELLTHTEKDRDAYLKRCTDLERLVKKLNADIARLNSEKQKLGAERTEIMERARALFEGLFT